MLLVFELAQLGVLVAERLEKVAAVAREAVAAFTGAALSRVEVVPQVRTEVATDATRR